jgi:hypothetical protein
MTLSYNVTLSIMTLSIMARNNLTLSIMTLNVMALSKMTLSIMAFSKITFSIGHSEYHLKLGDTQHNNIRYLVPLC